MSTSSRTARTSPSERSLPANVAEFGHALRHELSGTPLPTVLDELRRVFGAQIGASYVPRVTERGWAVQGPSTVWVGPGATVAFAAWRNQWVANRPVDAPVACYDPYAVPEAQRDVALTTADIARLSATYGSILGAVVGTVHPTEPDQLRMLLCAGPRLVAWVGMFRQEPFTPAEARAFQTLHDPLSARYGATEAAAMPSPAATLTSAVLEALREPAMIVGPRGTLEFANQSALRHWTGRAVALQGFLQQVRRREDVPGWSVTHVEWRPPVCRCCWGSTRRSPGRRADRAHHPVHVARPAQRHGLRRSRRGDGWRSRCASLGCSVPSASAKKGAA